VLTFPPVPICPHSLLPAQAQYAYASHQDTFATGKLSVVGGLAGTREGAPAHSTGWIPGALPTVARKRAYWLSVASVASIQKLPFAEGIRTIEVAAPDGQGASAGASLRASGTPTPPSAGLSGFASTAASTAIPPSVPTVEPSSAPAQGGQTLPPQSTPVSSPSRMPLWHVGDKPSTVEPMPQSDELARIETYSNPANGRYGCLPHARRIADSLLAKELSFNGPNSAPSPSEG
jgi:hypothetical protein